MHRPVHFIFKNSSAFKITCVSQINTAIAEILKTGEIFTN